MGAPVSPRGAAHRPAALLAAALLCLLAAAGRAAETPLPADLQARLLVRIYSFDRSLSRAEDLELTVGVLVQKRHRASYDAGEEMLAALRGLPASETGGRRLRVVAIEVETPDELDEAFASEGIEVLYVTPLRAFDLERLVAVARARRVRTLTAVPELLSRGLGVGLALREDRPEILINLEAALAEGADFSSQLLSHARVLR